MSLVWAGLLLLSASLRAAAVPVTLLQEDMAQQISLILPRAISLVPTLNYTIRCDEKGSGSKQWQQNGSPLPTAGGGGTAYASPEGVLHLIPFSAALSGQYMCVSGGISGSLNLTADNLVVIANQPRFGVEIGLVSGSIAHVLQVFASGIPQPTAQNYSWTFNGAPIDSSNFDTRLFVFVSHDRVGLASRIVAEMGGVYVNTVNTSAGVRSASIHLVVEVEPNPILTISSPPDYSTRGVAPDNTIILNCSDPAAVPPPSFSWRVNGTEEEEDASSSERESLLSLSRVWVGREEVRVVCVVKNKVEGVEREKEEHVVIAPPPPPSSLNAAPSSNCEASLSWTAPPDPMLGTPPSEYILIEAQLVGTDSWEIVERDMSLNITVKNVTLPSFQGLLNASYLLRLRGGNERGGDSPRSSNHAGPITLYSDPLPSLSFLRASPLLSSPSSHVMVEWAESVSSCGRYARHHIKCGTTSVSVGGGATAANVSGLPSDQVLECSVESELMDLAGNVFVESVSSGPVETFTYPDYKGNPGTPKISSVPQSPSNITVTFELFPNSDNISHYQVIVVRLRNDEPLPKSHPDTLFPDYSSFKTDAFVNDGRFSWPISDPYVAAEMAAEEFSRTFVIGSGRATSPSKQYSNGPLLSSSSYSCFLRAFPKSAVFLKRATEGGGGQGAGDGRQYVVFRSSNFLPVQQTASSIPPQKGASMIEKAIPGIAAGLSVMVMLAVLVILIICIIVACRLHRSSTFKLSHSKSGSLSPSSGSSRDIPELATPDLCRKAKGGMEMADLHLGGLDGEEDGEMVPSGAVPVNLFREHVERFDEDRQLLFQQEYDWIQANSQTYSSEASNAALNDQKNRYSNIIAYDHSRVSLNVMDGVEGSDYINANYIPGYDRSQEYISTQGPLDQTAADFWRMVWEQNSATIVMLTNLVELGKVKCSQYWPAMDSVIYGDLQIQLDSVVELRDYTIRNFTVIHIPSNSSHSVLQFHYTKWPDYGTPKLAAPLLNFLRAVHTSNPPEAGPIVVHCSAGVGRSGTVITIDYCLHQLKSDQVVDVRGFVSRMREHRNYMVQTETQYAFIHYASLEAITYGDTSFPLSSFSISYQHLQQRSRESNQTLLEEEYARLGSIKTMNKRSTFVQRVKQKGPTNRSIHYPGHSSYSEGVTAHEYNAHFIDAYFTPKLFIVSDGPEQRNVSKFWQMIWEQDCAYIIMLTPLDATYFSYWPGKGETERYGTVKVTVEEENAEHYYTTRVVRLSNSKVIGISQRVTQYQFVGLTTQYLPPVQTFVSFVCDVLKGVETLEKNQKALVHDMKSLGPSGIFCALCFCIERIRVERMVDVFQAVQNIQLQRPGMLESMQQYGFVYDCVYEFIRTHSNS